MGRVRTDDTEKYQTIRKGIPNLEQYKDKKPASKIDDAFASLKIQPDQLIVWRVNTKKLMRVAEDEEGKFYDGDSYMVLKSTQDPVSTIIVHNIYIWIGNYSTIDEFTYVAIKATELDQYIFHGAARQHREVQGNETYEFLTLFKNYEILKGGFDSSFGSKSNQSKSTPKATSNQNETQEIKVSSDNNRKVSVSENSDKTGVRNLYHVCGNRRRIKIVQVSYKYENINSEDVFILDHDHSSYYQFNGSMSNKDEQKFATKWLSDLKTKNPGIEITVIDESTTGRSHLVLNKMPTKNRKEESKKVKKSSRRSSSKSSQDQTKLLKLSDESGKMEFNQVDTGKKYKKSVLDPKDVYILDTGALCFVWVGKGASLCEKRLALIYTTQYLSLFSDPFMPIETIHDGCESTNFNKFFT